MNTHESYVSLEMAKLLKQAGFDWEIDTCYHRYYEGDGHDDSTPTEEFYFDVNRSWIHNWNNDALTYAEKTGELVHLSAPTLAVAQKWLREVKKYHIYVRPYSLDDGTYVTNIVVTDSLWGALQDDNKKAIIFKTYEEAQEAGIKKCLTLILEEDGI